MVIFLALIFSFEIRWTFFTKLNLMGMGENFYTLSWFLCNCCCLFHLCSTLIYINRKTKFFKVIIIHVSTILIILDKVRKVCLTHILLLKYRVLPACCQFFVKIWKAVILKIHHPILNKAVYYVISCHFFFDHFRDTWHKVNDGILF